MLELTKKDREFLDFGLKHIKDLEARVEKPEIVVMSEENGSPKIVFAGLIAKSTHSLDNYVKGILTNKPVDYYILLNEKPPVLQKVVPLGYGNNKR